MRDDACAFLAEGLVTAGVIAVIMRIDEIFHRLIGDGGNRRLQLVVHGRELGIDHDDPIAAHGHRDIAARAFEHIGVVAEVRRFHLNLREILLLRRLDARRRQCGYRNGRNPCAVSHGFPPFRGGSSCAAAT
jgi:hypothetical protein